MLNMSTKCLFGYAPDPKGLVGWHIVKILEYDVSVHGHWTRVEASSVSATIFRLAKWDLYPVITVIYQFRHAVRLLCPTHCTLLHHVWVRVRE